MPRKVQPETLFTALPALLKSLDRPGDYVGTGAQPLPVVRLSVDGVGPLGLPLLRSQTEALHALAEDAPYGRGPRTLVDRDVRRCGQIDAGSVHADDPRWGESLDAIVTAACKALGVTGAVKAELYKLLVYGPGDFFVEHRDTEKAPGMFATLVVALPSEHTGGELVVRHQGRETTVTLSGDDLGVARWVAFYCDCVHELRPVREGYRVALVYNLVAKDRRGVRVPDSSIVVEKLASRLRDWGPDLPPKVVLPLAHRYTQAELDFGTLKNHDAAAAQSLVRAASLADCTVQLAMLSIYETGAAEPDWDNYGSRRRGRSRDDEPSSYEVVEVVERSCVLHQWRSPDGARIDYGEIAVEEEDEVAPPDVLADAVPDEDELHEAMGNGGASFERTYRRAALVVWPDAREAEVLGQGGLAALLGALERHRTSAPERALSLARHIVTSWRTLWRRGHGERALYPRTLRALFALNAWPLVAELLAAVAASGGLLGRSKETLVDDDAPTASLVERATSATETPDEEVTATVDALMGLSAEDARRAAMALVRARQGSPFETLARVLLGTVRGRKDEAMVPVVEALAGALVAMKPLGTWNSEPAEARAQGLSVLLEAAMAAGGEALVRRVAEAVVHGIAPEAIDGVLVMGLIRQKQSPGRLSKSALGPILTACRAHLGARMASPPVAPRDATRDTDGMKCTCRDCAALKAFLRDPVAKTWNFKAAQRLRDHVQEVVRKAHLDVATTTLHKGSPHTLVCTKTTARYDARARLHAFDTAIVAAIEAWPT